MTRWPVLLATLAALAACAPREIPFAELRLDYAVPASRTFEPAPGVAVHYTDEGRHGGRTLILVHGFAASTHAWRPWIDRLADDYRIIAIDLPGHGLTETPPGYRATLEANAQLVHALATHLGVPRFILGGNSMGGAVALSYALSHPDKLDGLVLVTSAGWPSQQDSGPPGAFALLDNDIGRFILKLFDPRLIVGSGLKSAYQDETLVNQRVIDRYASLALARGHRDVLLTQRSTPTPPWTPETFRAIRTPTLVMSGEKDQLIPAANSRALAAAIPGAYFVSYPEGGHLPMEQLPDETVRHLKAFIRGLPSR